MTIMQNIQEFYYHVDRLDNIKKLVGDDLIISCNKPNFTLEPFLETIEKNELGKNLYKWLINFKFDEELQLEVLITYFEQLIRNEVGTDFEEIISKNIGEIIFEYIRQTEYSEYYLPSRYECFYMFNDIEEIKRWHEFNTLKQPIYKLKIIETQKIFKADSSWIKYKSEPDAENRRKILPIKKIKQFARNYWNTTISENSLIEYLFCGKLQIVDVLTNAEQNDKA